MKKHFIKIFLFLVIVGSIFWLGGFNIRAIIGNELFDRGTLNLKVGMSPEFDRALLTILAYSAIVTIIAYLIVFISSISYLLLTKPNLRQNGWLMAGIILFFIFSPVEFYVGYFDFKFVFNFLFGTYSPESLKDLLLKRVSDLSGLPAIAMFCYYTIIALLIWQPLKKSSIKEQISEK
jgi:hypothetical protein